MVLLVDTPGVLGSFMGRIFEALLEAKIPMVVYVSPKCARAASAGVFVASAANVLAVAPGTNIGAAYPAAFGGDRPKRSSELGR